MTARAGAEGNTMGTEKELRERLARGIARADSRLPDEDFERWFGNPAVNDDYLQTATAALDALGIPMSVLAWITANPEAAKGLASGEMVAVERTTRALITTAYNLGQDNAAASPPAPSGKAQGET